MRKWSQKIYPKAKISKIKKILSMTQFNRRVTGSVGIVGVGLGVGLGLG